METWLKNDLFKRQEGEEEPYLTAVHRLDRPVGGLMVFAKTKEAAAELSRQIQEYEFEKCYQAVVCGELPEEFGTFEDTLYRDGKTNTTKVVASGTKGAKKAVLDYEMIDQIETKEEIFSWVLVILHTGSIIRSVYSLRPGVWDCMEIQNIIQSIRIPKRNICSLVCIRPDWHFFIR